MYFTCYLEEGPRYHPTRNDLEYTFTSCKGFYLDCKDGHYRLMHRVQSVVLQMPAKKDKKMKSGYTNKLFANF